MICLELSPLVDRYRLAPVVHGVVAFESDSGALAIDAGAMSGAASAIGPRRGNLQAAFLAEWGRANRLVGASATDSAQSPPPEVPESPCWKAGRCLHTASGKKLHSFRNSALQALKTAMRMGTEALRRLEARGEDCE